MKPKTHDRRAPRVLESLPKRTDGHKSFSFRAKHKLPLTSHLDVTLDLMEDREIQLNKQVISDGGRGTTHIILLVSHTLCILSSLRNIWEYCTPLPRGVEERCGGYMGLKWP